MTYSANHSNAHKTYRNGQNNYPYITDVDNLPRRGKIVCWKGSIGKTVYHKDLGGIKILGICDNTHLDILFLRTGTFTTVYQGNLLIGAIKDPQQPSVFGVGSTGFTTCELSVAKNRIYSLWHGMINRCYNAKSKYFSYYGGNGVTVCDRWLRYEYFLEDIKSLEGYEQWLTDRNFQLDKDGKAIEGQPKQYSPETCQFISRADNMRIRHSSQTSSEAL